MMRDTLLKRLMSLAPETDVMVKIGERDIDFFEIVDVRESDEAPRAAILLHPGDLRDTIRELRRAEAGHAA